MGTWGEKVWQNDEAADFFTVVMKDINTEYILSEAEEVISMPEDNENRVRAISYILAHLGHNYIWPSKEISRITNIKKQLISTLENMIMPESEYMDLWDNDETLINEIKKEISALNEL